MTQAAGPILAAGAVVFDSKGRVLVVHRPAYDDLSLPKGKLERGESAQAAAVREVAEETGVRVALEAALPSTHYSLSRRDKQVDWWRARALEILDREPDDEVDKVSWLSVNKAQSRLTRADDRETLESALAAGSGPALIVLRHTKAVPRKQWRKKPDQLRPLNRRGKAQAQALIPVLAAYGVQTVVSSPSVRCMATVQPFAKQIGVQVRGLDLLSEEGAEAQPEKVVPLIRELLAEAADSGVPMVICGHRPVLPTMLDAAALPAVKLTKGGFAVRHLGLG